MADIKVKYLGLDLKNPVIAGASELSANIDMIKKIEDAGAGAIVIKSLFEEQIQLERYKLEEALHKDDGLYSEMVSVFPDLEHAGPEEHLMWLRKAKESVSIPVIGSLNAVNGETWNEYARLIEQTGVDALECNFYATPTDTTLPAADLEKKHIDIVKGIKKAIRIPLSIKLSPFYTSPVDFIGKLDGAGVDGFVLFNRLFQPDIDTDKEKSILSLHLSNKNDQRLPLRFCGLLFDRVKADICTSSGILEGDDVVKMILAGAAAVQVVTALYRNGIDTISKMRKDLEAWMVKKGYETPVDFRGKLNEKNSSDPWMYKRGQYVRLLMRERPLDS